MPKALRFLGLMLLGVLMSGVIAACNSGSNNNQATANQPKLTLVSYAVTQSAYEKIIPKFVQQWQEKTGQTVIFDQSYGGSGSQTRAVVDGLEADVVHLALSQDVNKIAKAGLIEPDWQQKVPNNAIVTKSVVALVTRENAPKISQWSELANNKLKVITANPKTSGVARWNFLALWGSVTQAGGNVQDAQKFVAQVYQNVPILPKDAREASDVFFKQGQGDVLINYENEVILASQKGKVLPYTIPSDYNISIDAPVAVVDANVKKHGTKEVAEAFVKYLFTPEAQREFAKVGFRPVEEKVAQEFTQQYPPIQHLFTVKDLGGWEKVQGEFFEEGGVFDKIINKI